MAARDASPLFRGKDLVAEQEIARGGWELDFDEADPRGAVAGVAGVGQPLESAAEILFASGGDRLADIGERRRRVLRQQLREARIAGRGQQCGRRVETVGDK